MKKVNKILGVVFVSMFMAACSIPKIVGKTENKNVPQSYRDSIDTLNSAQLNWRKYFNDSNLIALIDTALLNNQELNIIMQEINISKNEIRTRKGEYLPFLNIGAGAGADKAGEYTRNGALEKSTDIKPGTAFPETVPDFLVAANVSWEVDIWKKLRNAKKSAVYKYLSTVEGKNFMVTNLVAEISNSYYELMALDNQLEILKQNIVIQKNALEIVKLQKMAGTVTELAVLRFQAEVLKNQSRQFFIEQEIIETENRINYLVGRYPQPIKRDYQEFLNLTTDSIHSGIPSQLLVNRPDIKQAELNLVSSKLDIKVAKANFYPSLKITAGLGYNAFNPQFLVSTPKSLIYSAAGELIAPVINRRAIKSTYLNANAKQIQAAFHYEQTVLGAFVEVTNTLSKISNLKSSFDLKQGQVDALTKSINISSSLFKSARADYMEVLLTQRDALESKIELVEIKKQQMHAVVNIYQSLGGGWQ